MPSHFISFCPLKGAMRDEKPYCKPGESESHIALAWAIGGSVIALPIWAFFLLWALGLIPG